LARLHRVRFELHNDDPKLLQQLICWKQRQNVELGVVTPLGNPETAAVLKHILETGTERFSARMSVLWVDDEPAAISYCLTMPGTAHCWFLGFDEKFSRSSPGLILLLKLAEEFSRRGVKRLHLGKGNERFKTSLATGHLFLMEGVMGYWSLTLMLLQSWRRAKYRVKQSPLQAGIRLLRPVREWMTHGRK
jgi:CelD/BcsL family acetyltransferase involved in cellulose biosynthesis